MKRKLGLKAFALALAFLVGAAMTPSVVHTQNQNPATSTANAAKNTASKQAQNTANGAKSAANGAATQTGNAANSVKNGATNATNSAKNGVQSATPPQPGMVWANPSSKVYHKSGSQYYGKTKSGKWMTESDAQKAGYKAAKN